MKETKSTIEKIKDTENRYREKKKLDKALLDYQEQR